MNENALRVNDAVYLQNFKGIKNLGYHFDDTDNEKNKKGLAGDILGFNKYLTLGLKLSHNACPLLSVWDIQPFVFLNAALAPNRNANQAPEQESAGQRLTRRLTDHLRLSAGFGLTMDLEHIAIECYYNAYVSRQKNELRSDFQINFGID